MKNYFLVALVGFIIWAAATGKLMTWFNFATQKAAAVPAA